MVLKKEYRIGVLPGDGTGPEVIEEGIKVLKALSDRFNIRLDFKIFDIGGERYLRDGTLLPDDMVDELKDYDAIYLGAIGSPDVKPGILERGILLKLRFELDLYINLRPIKPLPGIDIPLKSANPEDIDFVVVRENTEGLYCGCGAFFKKNTPEEVAIQESINTRSGVERCIRYAFEICRERNQKKRVTLCGKSNVLNYEWDLWTRVFDEVSKDFPDIETDYQHVDALCMWMIKRPEQYDVIVTNNMFGDIITDIGAVLQGGLGVSAGANINPGIHGMFEPIGGSAPKYKGKNMINPIACILAGQMMLEFLGENEMARVLEGAVQKVVKEHMKSMDAGRMSIGTSDVGDLIVQYISN